MNGNEVRILVTADNKASAVLHKVKGDAAEAGKSAGHAFGGHLTQTLKTYGPALVGALSFGALVAFGKKSIETYESVTKAAVRTSRISGETVEAASKLNFAFKMTGLGTDQASGSLKRFSNFLVNTKDASKVLGMEVHNSTGHMKTMDQLLPAVAQKFKDMPNGIEKTALAVKLFGRNGTDMLPFLNKGADGLAELTKKAEQFGYVIGDKDAAAVKESMKAHREWGLAMDGLRITIGQRLVPVIEKYMLPLLEHFTELVSRKVIPMVRDMGDRFRDFALKHAEEFKKAWEEIGEGVSKSIDWLKRAYDFIDSHFSKSQQKDFLELAATLFALKKLGVFSVGMKVVGAGKKILDMFSKGEVVVAAGGMQTAGATMDTAAVLMNRAADKMIIAAGGAAMGGKGGPITAGGNLRGGTSRLAGIAEGGAGAAAGEGAAVAGGISAAAAAGVGLAGGAAGYGAGRLVGLGMKDHSAGRGFAGIGAGAAAGAGVGAGIGAFFGGVGAVPGAAIGGVVGAVGGALSDPGSLKKAWEATLSWFKKVPERVEGFFKAIPPFFRKLWDATKALTVSTWDSVVDWFKALPGRITGFLSELPGKIAFVAGEAAGLAVVNLVKVLDWFHDLPGNIARALRPVGSAVWNAIKAIPGLASRVVESSLHFFHDLPGKIGRTLKAIGSIVWSALKAVPGLAGRAVEGALDFFEKLPGRVMSFVGRIPGLVRSALSGIGSFFSGMWGSIKSVFLSGINGLIDLLNKAIDGFNKVTSKVGISIGKLGHVGGGGGSGSHYGESANQAEHHASGGIASGGPSWMNERGPELVRLPNGSTVIPAGTSREMMRGGISGGGETHIYLHLESDDADLIKRVRKAVRVEGAGNVQIAFGR